MKAKYYVIGTLGVIVLLIVGILLLNKTTPQAIPAALQESNVSQLATETYGSSNNSGEYIVYVFNPTCPHCQELMASDAYANFLNNPKVRLYKISTDDSKASSFLNDINITSIPTMIYIKKVSDGKYLKTEVVGSDKCENLLAKYTNK